MQTLYNGRPDSSAGNHFSFSRPNSEHLEYDAWAETIKNTPTNSFGRVGADRKIGPWVRRNTAPNSSSNSGTSFPPLWRSTTEESLPNFSRAQLIAKYRQEMMDLVRGLDEPAYELSLRDMVESPARMRPEEEVALTVKNASADWMEKKDLKRKGRGRTLRSSSRSESTGKGGFLLKLFMPTVPAVSRRETGAGVKVSPRPMAAAVDGEWSNCEYGERSSSNGSSGSSCGGRGTKRWKLCSCYAFLYRSRRSSSI